MRKRLDRIEQIRKFFKRIFNCSRKSAAVLDAFVRSFPFENTRLDDALRMFLETFRLPGEAAEISMVMQHFAGLYNNFMLDMSPTAC